MNLHIRPAEAKDAPALGVLKEQIARYHAQRDATQHRAVKGDGAHLLASWEKEAKKAWVAEDTGEVIGFLVLDERITGQEPTDARVQETMWYVNEIVVREDVRGQGVGTALLAHAEAEARKAGANTLAITYMEGNDGAKNLYTALGFRQAKITMRKGL